jgi:PAS domain S-box-containing protein
MRREVGRAGYPNAPEDAVGLNATETEAVAAEDTGDAGALLEAFLAATGDAVLTTDLSGAIVSWNQAAEGLYGYSAAEMIGRDSAVLALPGSDGESAELARRVLENGTVSGHETKRLRKDGSVVDVALTIAPVRDREDRVVTILMISHDIGRRRSAELGRELFEAKFSAAFHASPDLMALTRLRDGVILEVNEAFSELLGYSREESIGRTISRDLDLWVDPLAGKAFARMLTSAGRVDDVEAVLRCKDDRRVVGLSSARVLEVDGDACVLTVIHDVTARRGMEAERKARARLIETQSRANQAIASAGDLDGMLRQVLEIVFTELACDRAWLLRPCDPEAATFSVPMEVARPEYPGAGTRGVQIAMPADLAADLREALVAGAPITFVNGTSRPVNRTSAERLGVRSTMLMALPTKAGEAWAFGVHQCSYARTWTDDEVELFASVGGRLADAVTSLSALEELRRSEASYRRIVETAAEGILTLDLDGRTTFANAALAKMLGCGVREVLERPITEFMFAEDAEDHSDRLLARRTGLIERRERRFRRADGSELWVLVSGTLMVDEREDALGFLALLTDITERKRAQREVLELNERLEGLVAERTRDLEAACRELEAFSYSVSHDLRAPLRAIDGFSAALAEDCAEVLDDVGTGHLERVRVAAQRMGKMIDALLGLSRVARHELAVTEVDLGALASAIAAELQAAEPGRRVEVRIADGLVARGDRALVEVVLGNLLSNAWKFTGERDVAHIEVGSVDTSGETAFFVRDDGTGFGAVDADQVFKPFRRLCSEAEFQGDGIGLATVQRVVRRHGGRCWAEGEPGKGATLYFTLRESSRGVRSADLT